MRPAESSLTMSLAMPPEAIVPSKAVTLPATTPRLPSIAFVYLGDAVTWASPLHPGRPLRTIHLTAKSAFRTSGRSSSLDTASREPDRGYGRMVGHHGTGDIR